MAEDGNGAGERVGSGSVVHAVRILRGADRVGCDCRENEQGSEPVNAGQPRALTLAVADWRHAVMEFRMNRKTLLTLAILTAFSAGTAFAATQAPVEGRQAIREMFATEFATAKMVCIMENLFEDGEWAILEWRDPLGLRGCGFFHVKEGRIVFQRGYWDKLSFLRQQGLPLPTE
jgi:hypothetical protein